MFFLSIEKEIGLNSLIGSMNEKFISKKELLFAGGGEKSRRKGAKPCPNRQATLFKI